MVVNGITKQSGIIQRDTRIYATGVGVEYYLYSSYNIVRVYFVL